MGFISEISWRGFFLHGRLSVGRLSFRNDILVLRGENVRTDFGKKGKFIEV